MVFRFYISIPDKFIESWVGIYGNKIFNRLLYLYEMDPFSNKIELVGVIEDTPLNRRKVASWGFRDLTNKLSNLFEPKPTKIDLFTFDITDLVLKDPRLIKIIKKFKK